MLNDVRIGVLLTACRPLASCCPHAVAAVPLPQRHGNGAVSISRRLQSKEVRRIVRMTENASSEAYALFPPIRGIIDHVGIAAAKVTLVYRLEVRNTLLRAYHTSIHATRIKYQVPHSNIQSTRIVCVCYTRGVYIDVKYILCTAG